MAETSKIEWTDATFNPWTGCTRMSPGCDHCYAEAMSKRNPGTFGSWEPGAKRKRTSVAYWNQPHRWNRAAQARGKRMRVFCASLADVFDNAVPSDWREDLWALIHDTPHLDWLLLTKRPQNILKMLPGSCGQGDIPHARAVWGDGWPNIWLGTTVENQAEADRRIPHLLLAPAAKRFLSCEPLIEALDLRNWIGVHPTIGGSGYTGFDGFRRCDISGGVIDGIDWIITGGESGPKARPSHPDWFRSLRDQCQAAGVPFFFKQWGEWAPTGMIPPGASRAMDMERVGKKAAGAILDGSEWREVPA